MKKIFILGIILLFNAQCSTNKNPILLYNLNSQFKKTLKEQKAQSQLLILKTMLEHMVNVNSSPSETFDFSSYYKESLSAIQMASMEMGLQVENVNSSSILIRSANTPQTSFSQKIIFVIQLKTDALSNENLQNEQVVTHTDDGVVYGYQSLYPKGFLASLLLAVKDYSESNNAQQKSIEIFVTKDKASLESSKAKLQSLLLDRGLMIIPISEYPGAANMDGKLEFSLDIPQDYEWLLDITTADDNGNKKLNIKYKFLEGNSNIEKNQSFILSPSLDSYVENADTDIFKNIKDMAHFFTSYMNDTSSRVNLNNVKNQILYSLMKYLDENTQKILEFTGEDGRSIQLSHFELVNIKTAGRRIKLSFRADVSGENNQVFQGAFEEFIKNKVLNSFLDSNYTLNVSNYTPSYNVNNQYLVKQYSALLPISYNEVYKEKKLLTKMKRRSIPYQITPNILFMGVFFQSPSYYTNIHFIPDGKLFLDYQFILDFLSRKIKN